MWCHRTPFSSWLNPMRGTGISSQVHVHVCIALLTHPADLQGGQKVQVSVHFLNVLHCCLFSLPHENVEQRCRFILYYTEMEEYLFRCLWHCLRHRKIIYVVVGACVDVSWYHRKRVTMDVCNIGFLLKMWSNVGWQSLCKANWMDLMVTRGPQTWTKILLKFGLAISSIC